MTAEEKRNLIRYGEDELFEARENRDWEYAEKLIKILEEIMEEEEEC